jgi:hypothetical protein
MRLSWERVLWYGNLNRTTIDRILKDYGRFPIILFFSHALHRFSPTRICENLCNLWLIFYSATFGHNAVSYPKANCMKLLLSPIVLLISIQASSQKLSHSIGLEYVFPGEGIRTSRMVMPSYWSEYASTKLTRVSITYFPRYTMIGNREFSFSMGMPLTLGIGFPVSTASFQPSYSSSVAFPETGKTKPRLAAEIPVVADINIGKGASVKSKGNLGVFIGGGYAYNYASFYLPGGLYHTGVLLPYAHGGIRIGSKKIFSFGVTYRPGTGSERQEYTGTEERTTSWGIQVLRDL